jgi:hypothetical protein
MIERMRAAIGLSPQHKPQVNAMRRGLRCCLASNGLKLNGLPHMTKLASVTIWPRCSVCSHMPNGVSGERGINVKALGLILLSLLLAMLCFGSLSAWLALFVSVAGYS